MTDQQRDKWDLLGVFIEDLMNEMGIPGIAVGMMQKGETSTAGFGVTNVDHPLPVTPETLFQIGSITKTFTATVIMRLVDMVLPHLHLGLPTRDAEGPKTSWQRSTLLVLAITLHNIPEGLAVGVAFGAAASGVGAATVGAAVALAIGIGLQNFPEGMAVSLPLRREGMSRGKALWYGQLSGMVEPVAGVLGAAAVMFFYPMLPYALAFAAGAMIFVVIEEVIPESQRGNNGDIASIGTVLGFTTMMILDVALG